MNDGLRLLLTADAVGGVWQYSLDLARALEPLGIEATIAVLGPPPSEGQRRSAEGLRVIETGLPLDWLAADAGSLGEAGSRIAALARRGGADIVQVGNAALLAEAGFEMPTVAVQHSCLASWWQAVRGTALPADFAWRTDLVAAGLEAADLVVAPTAAFAAATRSIYGLEALPRAVHNGRAPLPLAPAPPQEGAFTAGRLWDEGKNLATLDAAAALISVPVHAAGPLEGPNGAGIALNSVHALGELDEAGIAERLSARPVFVSTALYEPFGLAVLEAAAAGCPLVLSDIPTFRELWDGAALFVPARDPEGFARAIGDLVGDSGAREALGRAARARAERYTPAATAKAMAALYLDLLEGRRRSSAAAAPATLAGAA